jgi:hypothetical protein
VTTPLTEDILVELQRIILANDKLYEIEWLAYEGAYENIEVGPPPKIMNTGVVQYKLPPFVQEKTPNNDGVKPLSSDDYMWFGMYKGKQLNAVEKNYRKWLLFELEKAYEGKHNRSGLTEEGLRKFRLYLWLKTNT